MSWTLLPLPPYDITFILEHSVPFSLLVIAFRNVLCLPVYKMTSQVVSFLTQPCKYSYTLLSLSPPEPLLRIPQSPLLESPYLKPPIHYRRSSYPRYHDYLLWPNEAGHLHCLTHHYLCCCTCHPLQGYLSTTQRTSCVSPLHIVLCCPPPIALETHPHTRRVG